MKSEALSGPGRGPAPGPVITPFEIGVVVLAALALLVPGLWVYTLLDPWETHYGEVARRMLEEGDWVLLKWQDDYFQSKPVLAMWLMAGMMQLVGVAGGGGYSGEMVSSPLVIFAVRAPFALFAAFGLVITWYALARLVNRRCAWIGLFLLGTTPFYFFIARQAITDMPMVACLLGALACFALATDDSGEAPLSPIIGRITGLHVFLGVFTLVVGGQAVYYFVYFLRDPSLGAGMEHVALPYLALPLPMLAVVAGLLVWTLWLSPVTTRRSLFMLWFYFLLGVSVLAKGPPAVAIAGATCLLYIVVTGRWRLLLRVEIPRGILIALAIAIPWHVAMLLAAGTGFFDEYILQHLLARASSGAHQPHDDPGTFNFFASQIGIGMWPWAGLLPAALAAVFTTRLSGSSGHLRLFIGLWAIVGVAFFCLVETKYHHYILPAIPALSLLVAFFVSDLLAGRVPRAALACVTAAAIVIFIGRDLMGEQKQLIEMFVYRYDRPWPSDPPWSVDLSGTLAKFTVLFAITMLALSFRRYRAYALGAVGAVTLVWALWAMNGYMSAAAPHWGQGELHRTYYEQRQIHGVDIVYAGLREVAEDWGPDAGDYEVESFLPDTIRPGQPATARLHLPGKDEPIALEGSISSLGESSFFIRVPENQRQVLREHIERGKTAPPSSEPPWVQVDADRLLAWQLFWRGENFWSGGEIFGRLPETQTVWDNYGGRDNEAFRAYLDEYGREGQTYFVITSAGRADRLARNIPREARDTVEVRDNSSNKFTLLSFEL